MAIAGLVVTILATASLAAAWMRVRRRLPFGAPGWIGLAVLAASACLLAGPLPKPAFLSALAGSGYVLAVDSAVYSLRGRSILRTRAESFLWLAVLSLFLWLPFEWYNLRLAVWYWAGLPSGPVRYIPLGWVYACVWPAIFETADLLLATALRSVPRRAPCQIPPTGRVAAVVVVGMLCLTVPVTVPRLDMGEHLFVLAGVGFLLLLDPLNMHMGQQSLWQDWLAGDRARCAALAIAGAYCGLVAECLNYRADAKLYGIASLGADFRVFELPVGMYLALPLFGLQAFAMHTFSARLLHVPPVELPTAPARPPG